MSMSGIKLRQWDSTPNNQEKFKIVTKFTDLGNPDSKKHVFGFYINISIEPQQNKLFTVNAFNTTEDDVFNIPNLTWQSLTISPPANSYFNATTYYLPQKQF